METLPANSSINRSHTQAGSHDGKDKKNWLKSSRKGMAKLFQSAQWQLIFVVIRSKAPNSLTNTAVLLSEVQEK